jgi:hypothetical protein
LTIAPRQHGICYGARLSRKRIDADELMAYWIRFGRLLRAMMDQFLADNPRGKHGQFIYNLKRDFGLTGANLKKRFQFYYDRFPVKSEVN